MSLLLLKNHLLLRPAIVQNKRLRGRFTYVFEKPLPDLFAIYVQLFRLPVVLLILSDTALAYAMHFRRIIRRQIFPFNSGVLHPLVLAEQDLSFPNDGHILVHSSKTSSTICAESITALSSPIHSSRQESELCSESHRQWVHSMIINLDCWAQWQHQSVALSNYTPPCFRTSHRLVCCSSASTLLSSPFVVKAFNMAKWSSRFLALTLIHPQTPVAGNCCLAFAPHLWSSSIIVQVNAFPSSGSCKAAGRCA